MRSSLVDAIRILNNWKTASTSVLFTCDIPELVMSLRVEIADVANDRVRLGLGEFTDVTLRLDSRWRFDVFGENDLTDIERNAFIACLKIANSNNDRQFMFSEMR